MKPIIVLLQQDLRLSDHPALYHAAKEKAPIIPVYIHDEDPKWPMGKNQSWWLWKSLTSLKKAYHDQGVNLVIRSGDTIKELEEIIKTCDPSAIYWNRCYDPHSRDKQKKIKNAIELPCREFAGALLSEPWDVANNEGSFFKVFTPFWKKLTKTIKPNTPLIAPQMDGYHHRLHSESPDIFKVDLESEVVKFWKPGEEYAKQHLYEFVRSKIDQYEHKRDFPSDDKTSRLSPHLHFGEITPRQIWDYVTTRAPFAEPFLREVGWREFSYYLLYHNPNLPSKEFRKDFASFPWVKNKSHAEAWKNGLTGYPFVDAGMRELKQSGWMHNRVRMVVASFLTKDLLIDWRVGEEWFWEQLVDADLANNSASWQWVAGCGADAAPYFRIFNPITQGEKFDPDGDYIRKWVPELSHLKGKAVHKPWESGEDLNGYPEPIIDHADARKKALELYERNV